MFGSYQPALQVGDTVEAGVGVAQIPDMKNWEVDGADRRAGPRAPGGRDRRRKMKVVALPGRQFTAQIKNIGGTTGPPWDRRFECKLGVERSGAGDAPGHERANRDHHRDAEERAVAAVAGAVRERWHEVRLRAGGGRVSRPAT